MKKVEFEKYLKNADAEILKRDISRWTNDLVKFTSKQIDKMIQKKNKLLSEKGI